VLGIEGQHWSARLLFPGELAPGQTCQAVAQLLVADALTHFPIGAKFTLWHGGVVGSGRVLSVAA